MKLQTLIVILTLLPNTLYASQNIEADTLNTAKEKQGYALGLDIGRNIRKLAPFLNLEKILLGLTHSFQGAPSLINKDDEKKYKLQISNQSHQIEWKKKKAIATKNLKLSMKFLEDNREKEEVKVLQSGLQYLIEKKGDGATPGSHDHVEVHYKGTLFDGTEFENTYSDNTPQVIDLDNSILAWQQAFPHMTVGSKFKLFVPSYLAYGAKGYGTKIQPNTALIFEIEFLSIKKSTAKHTFRKNIQTNPNPQQIPPFLQGNPSASIINLRGISLESLKKAAWSVLKLRNDIMPPYTDRHLKAVCDAVATDDFMAECTSEMNKRVVEIRSMRVMKAQFNNLKITNIDENANTVSIEWDEKYTIDQAPDISLHKTLSLSFRKEAIEFRMNSFSIK